MRTPRVVTIDFETEGIAGRPDYPPKPVGVAIKHWGRKAKYYAWGHKTKNNCTRREAIEALRKVWTKHPLLFHNAKFDIDVAETWLKIDPPRWDRIHDTLYLLFLNNPHQKNLSLKPSAAELLDIPPEEQEAVADWLLEKQPLKKEKIRISNSKKSEHYWARYICLAPGDLVGMYGIGDVDRTEELFRNLLPSIERRDMLKAYDRERRLMPILLEIERQGIHIDVARLEEDIREYEVVWMRLDNWIKKKIKAPSDINLDSGAQVMTALLQAKIIDGKDVPLTPTGKFQSNKEALNQCLDDAQLKAVFYYRAQLKTCMNTFMKPWLVTAKKSGGKIFTNWRQVKTTEAGSVGARTGRFSSTPNFQNIPKQFDPLFRHEDPKDKSLPVFPIVKRKPLPQVRSYIIPAPGCTLLGRDYSQQELRILAHFEGGVLLSAYQANPTMDVHEHARKTINLLTGQEFTRKPIKIAGFGMIYGMGLGALAQSAGVTVALAKTIKEAYLTTFPGLRDMYREMKMRAAKNEPIFTWGGREYYCEPSKVIDGRLVRFDYKMVNVLIQGSAADCTKEAIIRYWDTKPKRHRLLLSVHDELLVEVPSKEVKKGMNLLKKTMESVEFDLPMLSDGSVSTTNWAELKEGTDA